MGQFSQFVEPLPEYHHLNRLVDAVELHKIVAAGDGAHFDVHFDTMLAQMGEPGFGKEAQPLSRLETEAGGPVEYAFSPSERFVHTFAVMQEMAGLCNRDDFVAALMGPSATQLPIKNRYGVNLDSMAGGTAELRERFGSEHCVQFKEFIEPGLMVELCAQVARAPFRALLHDPLGVDYSMDFGPTQAVLHYLVTDRRLVDCIELVAGIKPGSLDRFSGRIYQMVRDRDRDGYHNDVHLTDRRLVAISVSMTADPCDGGFLHLRRKGWWRPYLLSQRAELGEAVVFRISRWLQHKAGDVYGGTRTNLAGWFCAREGFDYEGWLDAPCFSDDGKVLSTLPRRLLGKR